MRAFDTVLESSGSLVWDDRNFETFGYHSGYHGTIETHKEFVKIGIFYIFHVYVGHPDGTQVVPKISKSKNMMFELSNALSNVLIRHLDPNLEKVEFL